MSKTLFRGSILMLVVAFSSLHDGTALADKPIVTESYDISPEPCDGLDLDGITYAFTIAGAPSADCVAGTLVGPGVTNNIHSPNIEGSAAGVLHLRFDVPTTAFGFGVAQNTFAPQLQSVIVHLNRPGVGLLREEVFLDTTNDPAFVGARYDYRGPAVRTVTISFSGPFFRFALDNVTYFRPPGQSKK